jgi:cell division protein FtsB
MKAPAASPTAPESSAQAGNEADALRQKLAALGAENAALRQQVAELSAALEAARAGAGAA